MLGFIKNLFGKGSEDKKAPQSQAPATPAAKPQPVAAAPSASAPAAKAPSGETIEVSLKGVLDGLPPELKGLVTAQPAAGATIKVPLQRVLDGLPKGNVKITYAELKAQGGSGFGGDASLDQTPVNLPLKEVLSKIKPGQFTRRADQKTIDIPDDIKPVFGADGTATNAPGQAASHTPPAPTPAAAAPAPAPAPSPKPAAPAPAPAPSPKPAAPAPAPAPKAAEPAPAPPAPKAPEPAPAPAPAPVAEPAAPIKPSFSLPDPASLRPGAAAAPAAPKPAAPAPTPAAAPAPKPAPAPTPAPAAAAPAPASGSGGTLSTTIDTIYQTWPEDVKGELNKLNANTLTLTVPLDLVEPMMRKGKILFAWSQLRSWVTPALPASLGANRDAENMELPLKVIIPIFMAARKPGATAQKTIAVDQNIPDVFAGKMAAAAAPAPAAPAPTPAPAAAPAPAPTPVAAAPAPATGPADLVAKVSTFANVAGVVLASPEGLKIAAQLPSEFNADAFAGFVVAMFSRMNQFTGDLKLGEPQLVNVQTNSRNLVIIKSGRTFLAVIGKPDASLALDDLKKLAATLS